MQAGPGDSRKQLACVAGTPVCGGSKRYNTLKRRLIPNNRIGKKRSSSTIMSSQPITPGGPINCKAKFDLGCRLSVEWDIARKRGEDQCRTEYLTFVKQTALQEGGAMERLKLLMAPRR